MLDFRGRGLAIHQGCPKQAPGESASLVVRREEQATLSMCEMQDWPKGGVFGEVTRNEAQASPGKCDVVACVAVRIGRSLKTDLL